MLYANNVPFSIRDLNIYGFLVSTVVEKAGGDAGTNPL